MLNLKLATTMEIQLERDNCDAMLTSLTETYQDGFLTIDELIDQSAWYAERYQQCVDRLLTDWVWAAKVAEGLA
jgi:hypothetical protein